VQRHGGLARAGAALDDDDAARRLGDELELLLVDQRGDLGQRLVGPRGAVVDAERALGAGGGGGARCLAHAAVQDRRELTDRLHPGAARVLQVGALRRADPAEIAARDRYVAADLDDAFDPPTGDLLLVVVAFLVAVVDPRHRRVAPVDDLDVGLAVDEAALADQDVLALAALAQPDVREVRRRDVDRQLLAAAEPAAQRREPGHLLDERRQVLGAGLGDLVAQRDQVGIEITGADLGAAVVLISERDPRLDLPVQALLLGDDLRRRGALCDFIAHPGTGESI
jgi:hypothetical protein